MPQPVGQRDFRQTQMGGPQTHRTTGSFGVRRDHAGVREVKQRYPRVRNFVSRETVPCGSAGGQRDQFVGKAGETGRFAGRWPGERERRALSNRTRIRDQQRQQDGLVMPFAVGSVNPSLAGRKLKRSSRRNDPPNRRSPPLAAKPLSPTPPIAESYSFALAFMRRHGPRTRLTCVLARA
jgi:hypothetical protein